MFEDEISALETEEERSARHSRMVLQAALFVLVLPLLIFGFGAVWLWIRDGSVDLGVLLIPFLIVVAGVGAGMAFEVKRRW